MSADYHSTCPKCEADGELNEGNLREYHDLFRVGHKFYVRIDFDCWECGFTDRIDDVIEMTAVRNLEP